MIILLKLPDNRYYYSTTRNIIASIKFHRDLINGDLRKDLCPKSGRFVRSIALIDVCYRFIGSM